MNEEIKKLWVEALRSGEYVQGREGQLRMRTSDGFTYCCLGVLTDLYAKAHQEEWDSDMYGFGEDDMVEYMNGCVVKWAGLRDGLGRVDKENLVGLNDSGTSFEEIADIIEGGENM